MSARVYLDHHSATKPFPSAVEALLPFFKEYWGSFHAHGQQQQRSIRESVRRIHAALGARQTDHFSLTATGAEAIASVYDSVYFHQMRETGKTHVLATSVEEASIMLGIKRLELLGCSGKILPVNAQGQLTKEALEAALRPRVGLVSLSWANGLTGVIHPIEDLASLCRARGVLLHVDASDVIGRRSFRFQDLGVDFLSFEGQRIHAPRGASGLVSTLSLSSLCPGVLGPNVGALAALAETLEQNLRHFDHVATETARLRDLLEKEVLHRCPGSVVFFRDVERLPHCSAIGFPGIASDALAFLLNRKGVYVTAGGGHCQTLFHILIACGIAPPIAQTALSFSLSYETTEEEIDYAVEVLAECVAQLKRTSLHIGGSP